MALTKAQAYRFVLVAMASWARNAAENPNEDQSGEDLGRLLSSFAPNVTLDDAVLICREALAVATAAHILLAENAGHDPVLMLESLVLDDARDEPYGPV